jgi:hypothetical protein
MYYKTMLASFNFKRSMKYLIEQCLKEKSY